MKKCIYTGGGKNIQRRNFPIKANNIVIIIAINIASKDFLKADFSGTHSRHNLVTFHFSSLFVFNSEYIRPIFAACLLF